MLLYTVLKCLPSDPPFYPLIMFFFISSLYVSPLNVQTLSVTDRKKQYSNPDKVENPYYDYGVIVRAG